MQNDVVYQAFQINTGYILKDNEWKSCGIGSQNHAQFKSIGKDETGIPIIVTRIGEDGFNKKKLVIAGPHGDERNAQRLILTTQRYFTQNGRIPNDLALYFIPSISPTMAFADARGIPNEFWVGGENGTIMRNGPYTLKELNIPDLHDALKETVRINGKDELMRTAIQKYNNPPNYPKYGVDANRDYYSSLKSSQMFSDFIDNIKPDDKGIKKITTTTIEGKIFNKATFKDMRVLMLMLHDYDETGAVYGPYSVSPNQNNLPWPAKMSEDDKDEVDMIMLDSLGMLPFKNERHPRKVDITRGGSYLYISTATDARPYQGEWIRKLYEKDIWAADIELADKNTKDFYPSYNEGKREDKTDPYTDEKRNLIGEEKPPYFQGNDNNGFYKLIRSYPWPQ